MTCYYFLIFVLIFLLGGSEDLRQRLDALRVEGGASWLEMLNELYPQVGIYVMDGVLTVALCI